MDFPAAEQTAWYAAKVGTAAVLLICGGGTGTVRTHEVSRVSGVPVASVVSSPVASLSSLNLRAGSLSRPLLRLSGGGDTQVQCAKASHLELPVIERRSAPS